MVKTYVYSPGQHMYILLVFLYHFTTSFHQSGTLYHQGSHFLYQESNNLRKILPKGKYQQYFFEGSDKFNSFLKQQLFLVTL